MRRGCGIAVFIKRVRMNETSLLIEHCGTKKSFKITDGKRTCCRLDGSRMNVFALFSTGWRPPHLYPVRSTCRLRVFPSVSSCYASHRQPTFTLPRDSVVSRYFRGLWIVFFGSCAGSASDEARRIRSASTEITKIR